ncbi:hypothetical protein ACSQ67_014624 [Phaseolus vulgaris]
MSELLPNFSKKIEVDTIIRDTFDKVVVLRFGRASDLTCLQQDHILSKAARDVSKFATVALVDVDSEDIHVYVKTADHTKWIGAFFSKQDFIDVVEVLIILIHETVYTFLQAIFRGAMKGKLIVNSPLPPERIPNFQILYKDV